MPDFDKIFLFRITHIDNIPHIIKNGITHLTSQNSNPQYKSIGDSSLINNRDQFELPGGKKLGDYIPFYFGFRMPMLFVIQNGYNGVIETKPENIVYCVTSISLVLKHQLNFIFSNGHAVDKFSEFFESGSVNEIQTIVDFNAVKAKYWKSDSDLDLKRRKEAEFLLENNLPSNAIRKYIVYNKAVKEKLIHLGIEENLILVSKEYYF